MELYGDLGNRECVPLRFAFSGWAEAVFDSSVAVRLRLCLTQAVGLLVAVGRMLVMAPKWWEVGGLTLGESHVALQLEMVEVYGVGNVAVTVVLVIAGS